jgi:hypothetical protein
MKRTSTAGFALTTFLLPGSLVLLAPGCGDTSDDQRAAQPEARIEDPCALLSTTEVGQALGTTVTGPDEREATSGTTLATICVFDGGWPNNVNLTVRQGESSRPAIDSEALAAELNEAIDDMEESESMNDLVEGGRWLPLDMAGHAAAVRDAGEGGWTVAVKKGGRTSVEVLLNAPSRGASVQLAGMVMTRLD